MCITFEGLLQAAFFGGLTGYVFALVFLGIGNFILFIERKVSGE